MGNNGVRIAWQSFGGDDRPVIVFSHSLGLDSSTWRPQVEALVDDFRIVARGYPRSWQLDMSPKPFTLEGLAGDVLAAAAAAGADRFHFCGISMGGQIAMWTAIRIDPSGCGPSSSPIPQPASATNNPGGNEPPQSGQEG